jgi:hypothetical protein
MCGAGYITSFLEGIDLLERLLRGVAEEFVAHISTWSSNAWIDWEKLSTNSPG